MKGQAAPEPPTADLVGLARAGDRGAFGGLYERYARMVHGLLLAHAASGTWRAPSMSGWRSGT